MIVYSVLVLVHLVSYGSIVDCYVLLQGDLSSRTTRIPSSRYDKIRARIKERYVSNNTYWWKQINYYTNVPLEIIMNRVFFIFKWFLIYNAQLEMIINGVFNILYQLLIYNISPWYFTGWLATAPARHRSPGQLQLSQETPSKGVLHLRRLLW